MGTGNKEEEKKLKSENGPEGILKKGNARKIGGELAG